jgi:hypothetical protein
MKMRPYVYLATITSFLILLVSGCMGQYGNLRVQSGPGERMTTQMLIEHWQDYHVYWAGPYSSDPAAVMFDPKNDNMTIVPHPGWREVKNKDELVYFIALISVPPRAMAYYPHLMRILGPNGELYGYMYTSWDHVYMKQTAKDTLWVDNIPLPPIDYGPNSRRG